MTQQEIWDDSALVQAFNKAINSYKESHDPKKRAEGAAKDIKGYKKNDDDYEDFSEEEDDQYNENSEEEYEEDVKYQSKQQPVKAKQTENTSQNRSKKRRESEQDNETDDYTRQWQEYYAQINSYNNANNQYFNGQFPSNPNPAFNSQSSYPPNNPYAPSYYPNQWGGYGQSGPMPGPVPSMGPHQWQMPMISPPPPPQFTNDKNLAQLLWAWYFSGYYAGIYEASLRK